MNKFTVIKRDYNGKTKLEYHGELVEQGTTWVCVRAAFTFERVDMGFVEFLRGDIFTEWFFTNRWYNIFQVNDRKDGQLKGWYCNITRPAVITPTNVAADDLELDVFVTPTGELMMLDEDEFAALCLSDRETKAALNAVQEIRRAVEQRSRPFHLIDSAR